MKNELEEQETHPGVILIGLLNFPSWQAKMMLL
jgi:hypothetical protein